MTTLQYEKKNYEKSIVSNKLIINEILEVKKRISEIIISTKNNKNKLKKLYKKDKKINANIIRLNKNKDKKILKIVTTEIATAKDNYKKLTDKLDNIDNLNQKYKKIIFDLENKNTEFDTLTKKILFYQNESIRLSAKLKSNENINKTINENLITSENKKKELIQMIQDLNNYLFENSAVKINFDKQKKNITNDLKEISFPTEIKKNNSNNDLDDTINKIFSD